MILTHVTFAFFSLKKAIDPLTGIYYLYLRVYRHIKILPYPTYFYNKFF